MPRLRCMECYRRTILSCNPTRITSFAVRSATSQGELLEFSSAKPLSQQLVAQYSVLSGHHGPKTCAGGSTQFPTYSFRYFICRYCEPCPVSVNRCRFKSKFCTGEVRHTCGHGALVARCLQPTSASLLLHYYITTPLGSIKGHCPDSHVCEPGSVCKWMELLALCPQGSDLEL